MSIPELQVSTVSAGASGRPKANLGRNDRKLLGPKLPRLGKERHSRTSGSRRKELGSSKL
jgi:hypothetical protein